MRYLKPELIFSADLPSPKVFGPSALLIFDHILLSHITGFQEWTRKFPAAYAVRAGEELKDLSRYPKHMEKILHLADDLSPKDLVIVVAGGGSVGDFGGFTASILKRGVKLIHIPTTWLAAIDSAHGGKTALNVGGTKNQIGTFYSANQIFLVQSALFSQGSEQAQDAFGELAKITLISSKKAWRNLTQSEGKAGNLIWSLLPQTIAAKYKIVSQDPFEKKRIRQILNLGHTMGHVMEAYHGLSHGASVAQGLLFCIEWSHKRKILNTPTYNEIKALLLKKFLFLPLTELKGFHPIPEKDFFNLLRSDKKRTSTSEITFVFLQDIGKAKLVDVTISSIIKEAKTQGWVE